VGATESRYDPMHDDALIGAGLARYGPKRACTDLLGALFDVSQFVDLHRLPELFCGFDRRPHESPTLYPVACAPQACAAGAVFPVLAACLGLTLDAPNRRIRLDRPVLPPTLEWITPTHLRLGDATVDLSLARHGEDVGVNLLRRTGEVEIVIVK
jgi:glycogen debranching enzyme